VRQRVARLTADGVMQITAVTNPLLIGYDAVCMLASRRTRPSCRPPPTRWPRWTRSPT
jgi:hypothetical protein